MARAGFLYFTSRPSSNEAALDPTYGTKAAILCFGLYLAVTVLGTALIADAPQSDVETLVAQTR
jgi:hypothetical protein